jgi:ribonucleoside-diphosphate reductase alpha chain
MKTARELRDPQLTDNATTVLGERYLIRDDSGNVIETPKQMFLRVAQAVAAAERPESREFWTGEFYEEMTSLKFLPNSPCLMNAGRKLGMLSACFVLGVEDDLHSIADTQKAVMLVQRAGGGTGFNFSKLRPNRSIVKSSGGTTAGPLSFIDAYSSTTTAIQQGAFRRGANMAILNCDHPDIIDFIMAKSNLTRWQNYNVSVAVTDEFMDMVETQPSKPHLVQHPEWGHGALWRNGETGEIKAFVENDDPTPQALWYPWTYSNTWDLICQRAWETGEPGLFFIDAANRDDPLAHTGRINSTNPCGEQPLHDWDSCTLGSINLTKFVDEHLNIDWKNLERTVRTAVRFLDNVIDVNNYPIPEIKKVSQSNRRIGLGVMGWADLLFMMGMPYGSKESYVLAGGIMKAISSSAHKESTKLGQEKGSYPSHNGEKPMRNSYTTTVAPTGTISIIADCSGGIEPAYALAFTRRVMPDADGNYKKMTQLNEAFQRAISNSQLSYQDKKYISDYAIDNGNIKDFKITDDTYTDANSREAANESLLELSLVFVTAHELSMEKHVDMQAAWQEHVDSAISKTINLQESATPETVSEAYRRAYFGDCKGITVYRDGCRDGVEGMVQPMKVLTKEQIKDMDPPFPPENGYDKLAASNISTSEIFQVPEDFSPAMKTTMKTPFGSLHVNIVMDNDGNPIEFFAQIGKAGDIIASDLEAICRLASLFLRNGGTLEQVIDQLSGIGSTEIMPSPDGKIVSLPDALAKVLLKYISRDEKTKKNKLRRVFETTDSKGRKNNYGIVCPSCNSGNLHPSEGCQKCELCGFSKC